MQVNVHSYEGYNYMNHKKLTLYVYNNVENTYGPVHGPTYIPIRTYIYYITLLYYIYLRM